MSNYFVSNHHKLEPNFYVKEILGIEISSLLREGKRQNIIEEQIIREHLLLEGWLDDTANWLSTKSSEAFQKIKDTGVSAVEALSSFPDKLSGVVASIYKILTDPQEAQEYLSYIRNYSKFRPLEKVLTSIGKLLTSYGMPNFGQIVNNIRDLIFVRIKGQIQNLQGWKGFFGFLTFNLGMKWFLANFQQQLYQLEDFLKNPIEKLSQLLGNAFTSEISNRIQSAITSKAQETIAPLMKQLLSDPRVISYLNEITGIYNKVKEFFTGIITKLTGRALEAFAGPVAWIKQAAEYFSKFMNIVDVLSQVIKKPILPGNQPIAVAITETVDRLLNEFVVPVGYSLSSWKEYRKKNKKTNADYHKEHPDRRWKVVHGHKAGEIGKSLPGMSDMSYQEATRAHAAIAMRKG